MATEAVLGSATAVNDEGSGVVRLDVWSPSASHHGRPIHYVSLSVDRTGGVKRNTLFALKTNIH